MKPDSSDQAHRDAIERAHLRRPDDDTSTVHRYGAPAGMSDLIRRFWIPVWSIPAGQESVQNVLQYPVSLLIITPAYARFMGVHTGLSSTTLVGDGFGVGVMFQPAAGVLIAGGSMDEWTDRHDDISAVMGSEGTRLAHTVRGLMADDPGSEASHHAAMSEVEAVLARYLPVDEEGLLVNEIVQFVEDRSDVTRVAQVCDEFHLSERSLQRLTNRRLGLKPKWVIQRRRLQEAADRLRSGHGTLAAVAAELGYADQAHLARDWQSVTGLTPGEFARQFAT